MTDPLPGPPGLPDLPPARREWQLATVEDVRVETPHARTFRLALPHWEAHLPGQHYVVRLTAPDGYRAERSYSVASPPQDAGVVELSVERLADGEVSGYLHDALGVGDQVEVRGPFGGWFVWRPDSPALLVGGGSGVVPLAAMARTHRVSASSAPLHLVVSTRSREDLLYAQELLDGAGAAQATVLFSRVAPPEWPRPAGRITAGDLAPHVERLGPDELTAYVCGSARFARAAERLLVELGVPRAGIRAERFGP